MKRLVSVVLMIAALAAVAGAQAGDFPSKPITFVVPFDAGGTADIPARILAKYMGKYSAKPVNVVNIVGAGGAIGAREVMRAKPDGYTVLHIPAGFPMQYALGSVDFSYKDFESVCVWLDSYLAIVVRADSKYKTLADLVNAARGKPDAVKLGTVSGTLPFFAGLKIEDHEKVNFKNMDLGAGAKAPELLGGRIDTYIDGFGAVQAFIKGGQFRALGVYANSRLPGWDNIPTFKEMGYQNTAFLDQMFGMWAPKGTPEAQLDYIGELVRKATEDPAYQADVRKLSYGPRYTPRNEYEPLLVDVYAAFADFTKRLNLKK